MGRYGAMGCVGPRPGTPPSESDSRPADALVTGIFDPMPGGVSVGTCRAGLVPGRQVRDLRPGGDSCPSRVVLRRVRPVGAENPCHQAIFVDDATRAVMPPDPEMIQVGDAVWQGRSGAAWSRAQWRCLKGPQGAIL